MTPNVAMLQSEDRRRDSIRNDGLNDCVSVIKNGRDGSIGVTYSVTMEYHTAILRGHRSESYLMGQILRKFPQFQSGF